MLKQCVQGEEQEINVSLVRRRRSRSRRGQNIGVPLQVGKQRCAKSTKIFPLDRSSSNKSYTWRAETEFTQEDDSIDGVENTEK